jgi:predicted O-methyltransferase YrrM
MSNIRYKAVLTTHPDVMMDDCHIDLIHALVLSAKPESILEIGIGSGAVTMAMLDAAKLNGNHCVVTCVDNFGDWNGAMPDGFQKLREEIQFVNSSEKEFASECRRAFDFVVSDADHANTGEWFDKTLDLVNPGGILIYHDATSPHCPSVRQAVENAKNMGLSVLTFNKSSHNWEQCERGLAVIQKP